MEDCAPSTFLGSWALVAPYLWTRFRIFNRPVLEEYVFWIKGGLHLFHSCLHVVWNGLPPIAKELDLSFESVTIIRAPSLQASLTDIHHDTSLKFILEDDFISSTSKARIRSYLSKGACLWLVVKPSIYSFCIAHFIFTSTLHFHMGLIQPSAFCFITCECEHRLDASSTHLICCTFGGQWIATHDAIWNVIYALTQKSGHVLWKETWYAFTSRISLFVNP
jgi:hypothetical protein